MGNKIKELFISVFSLESDSASPENIRESILNGSRVRGTNMCILILAIFIASIGLNMNSTPVIIGAMLISPLMGGIMAIGYGIALNDLSLSKNAFIRLLFQVIVCIITSTLYFSVTPILTAHSELLARTNPTIWDVLIAIFGGLAGIIGVTRKEKTNVIPGVAIATALMPPLCTAGYGLATHSITFFAGAMYLFFINSFFICVTTIIVIKFMNLPKYQFIDDNAHKKVRRNILIIAVITIIPSVYLAYQIVNESMLDNNIQQYISKEFIFDGTQVVKTYVDKNSNEIEVALLGKQIDNTRINELKLALKEYNLSNMNLVVTQTELREGVSYDDIKTLIEKEFDETDKNNNLVTQAKDIESMKAEIVKYKAQLLDYKAYDFDIASITKELKALYPQITDCSIGQLKRWDEDKEKQEVTIAATVDVNKILLPEQKEQLTNWLETKTNSKNIVLFENVKTEYSLPVVPFDQIKSIRLKTSDSDEYLESSSLEMRKLVSDTMAECKITGKIDSLNEIFPNGYINQKPNIVVLTLNSGEEITFNCFFTSIPHIHLTVNNSTSMYYVDSNWDIKFLYGIEALFDSENS